MLCVKSFQTLKIRPLDEHCMIPDTKLQQFYLY